MNKIVLVCTVGGSHQPIVTSITRHRPQHVVFICSDDCQRVKGSYTQVVGDGMVLKSNRSLEKPDLPNIATIAGLGQSDFTIHKVEMFDDLNACYLASMQAIDGVRISIPEARIVVDYTGGTKSMTAGLAAAALDDGRCEIAIVAGHRSDLVAVQDRTEFVRPVLVWDAQILRRVKACKELLRRFDYAGAENLLCDAAARYAGNTTLHQLQTGIAFCRAYDAWDKFQHQVAFDILQPLQTTIVPWWRVLKNLTGVNSGYGFERVEDLLLNAERRASQERYDDAVGRVYRAIELTAQIWLELTHEIQTANVDLEKTPESSHEPLAKQIDSTGRIKIGLLAAWDLIRAYPDDPLGRHFDLFRPRMLNFLEVRNQSLFAHGFRPVSLADYRVQVPAVMVFLRECLELAITTRRVRRDIVMQQLPIDFLD